MPNNIFQQRIKPVTPKVLANERVFVYVPRATTSEPGIAYYNPEDFTVSNLGQVSIIWPYAHEGGFGLVQIAPDAAGYLEFTDDENHYLQVAIDELDVHVNELIDVKVAAHNIDTTAHQDIRNLIVTRIAAHNISSTAHQDIRATLNSLQSQIDNIDLNTEGLIEEHNTSPTAHSDIRELIATEIDGLDAKIEALNSVEIRNIAPNLVIQATEENVQSVATQYIVDNYSRNPETNDGLYITRTDLDNDVIQYAYFNNVWVNVGMNKVDLSNYVDLTSAQNISGAKNFAGGLTKNGKEVLTVDDNFDLQDLPQFTNKLEIDLSYAPSLNGLITFPIVSSSNFYVNWGDGTGTYYQEATTSMSHQYSDTEFAGWITIYGDWQGLNFVNSDRTAQDTKILTSIIYDDNITEIPRHGLSGDNNQLVHLKTLKLSDKVTSIGSTAISASNLIDFKLPSQLQTLSGGAIWSSIETNYFEIPSQVTSVGTYSITLSGGPTGYNNVVVVFKNISTLTFSGTNFALNMSFANSIIYLLATAALYIFSNATPFEVSTTNIIFVQKSQLQQFKTKTNLTTYADKIYPIGGNYTESITIQSTSWNAETKTVTVTAIGATSEDRNVVMPSIPSEYDDYGIRCTAQGTMTLTFTCDTVPTEDVTIGVAYMLTNQ